MNPSPRVSAAGDESDVPAPPVSRSLSRTLTQHAAAGTPLLATFGRIQPS
jgi:hypothetical protein